MSQSTDHEQTAIRVGPPATGRVPLSWLRPADSPRLDGPDAEHVRLLAQVPGPLPPILVHWPSMRVVDGTHRVHAAQLRDEADIDVVYFVGDEDESFVRAVEANVLHGLPLSLADRRAAARRILQAYPEWSDRAIGQVAALSPKTVGSVRRAASEEIPQLTTRLGRDGRRRAVRAVADAVSDDAPGVADADRAEEAADVPDAEARITMQSLCRDPSLRLTESGRTLLRKLISGALGPEEFEGLAAAVPPHCLEPVAELAAAHARAWERFARNLRQARCDDLR